MEIAQVGVRTRARAALAMGAASSAARTPKRRKINNRDEEQKFSTASSEFVQLKSRRRSAAVDKPETTATVLPELEEHSSGPISNEFPASCCSSNGSVGLDEERMINSVDLEVESAQVETSTCNCGEEIDRREMSYARELREKSQELESTETDSRRPTSTAQNMPTELELEEFFATAERDIQKRFQDKYNYDIVKDVPLEGRYEWVQLKP